MYIQLLLHEGAKKITCDVGYVASGYRKTPHAKSFDLACGVERRDGRNYILSACALAKYLFAVNNVDASLLLAHALTSNVEDRRFFILHS